MTLPDEILNKYHEILFPYDYVVGKYSIIFFDKAIRNNIFYKKANSNEEYQLYEELLIKSIKQIKRDFSIYLILEIDQEHNFFLVEEEEELISICQRGFRELIKVKILIQELSMVISIGQDLLIVLDYLTHSKSIENIEKIFIKNGSSIIFDIDEFNIKFYQNNS